MANIILPLEEDHAKFDYGPRSRALWIALKALHHLRYGEPARETISDGQLEESIEPVWIEYMRVAMEEAGIKS
jgi:hypothetical protein